MKANKVHVKDIRELGSYDMMTVELPSYKHCRTASNVVNYVRKAYPRKDGLGYWMRINGSTITIGTADTDRINRKMTVEEIKEIFPNNG